MKHSFSGVMMSLVGDGFAANDHARQNGARPGDYDHDELLVANTYLNSQPQGDPRQLRSMTANGRLRRDRSRGVGRRRVQWIDDPSRKNTAHTDVPRSPRTHRPTAERPPTPSYNSLKPANGWNDTGERNRSHERPQSAHAALISILKNSPKWKEDTKEKQANVRFAIESSSSQEASAVSQISTSTDQSTPTKAAERGQDMPNIFAQNARPKKEHPEISAHKANKYHIPPTPPISSESEGLGDEGYAPEAKARHSDPPIRQYNQQQHHSTSKNARGFSIQGSSSMSSAGMTFPGTERQVSATTRPNSSSATLSSSGRPPKGSSTQHMNGEGVLLSNALHTEGISGRNAGSSGLFRYAGKSSGDNVSLPPSPHGATTQKFFGGEAVAALQNTHSHNNVRSSSVRPSTSENDVHRGRSKQGSNQHSHKRYATPPPRQWGRQERQTRNTSSGGPRPVSASATTHSKSNPALPTQLYLTSHSQLGGSKQDGRGGGDFWPPIGKQSNASNPRTGKVRTGGKLQQQHPIRIAPMPHNNSLHGSAENTTSQLQSNGWRPQSAAARVGPVAVRTTDGYLGLRQDLNAVPKINQASKQGKRRGSPSSNRRSKSSSRTNSPSSGKKPAKGNSRSRLKITTP